MAEMQSSLSRLAVIYGTLPSVEEIDQLQLIADNYDITVISSESIIGFLSQNSFFKNLKCQPLPDHEDHTTFLPGLENILEDYELVIVKERLGVYAFQAVKAKWKHRFRLLVWIDNLTPFPGEDVPRMRIIREEVNKAADGYLVQTRAARQSLLLEGVAAEKIFFVPASVQKRELREVAKKRQALERLGLHERDFLIVHNGQVEWEEGFLDLLHGLKMVKEQDSSLQHRLKLAVCGIGSFATELKQRSIILGLDRDIFYYAPNRDTYLTLLQASEAIFVGGYHSRDRIDGDPFRLVSAMTHGIPVLAPRCPLVEELVGKHRLDYCVGSGKSLVQAIKKLVYGQSLNLDLVQKNQAKVADVYSATKAREGFLKTLQSLEQTPRHGQESSLDQQVHEVEAKIGAGQFLAAIDLIESIFDLERDIPSHHQANLYRLIGDCFTKLGDSDAGKRAYVQAIEWDAYSAKAHIGLGTVSLMKSNYDIGVIHFQKAISLAPNDEMANLGLGLSFHGLDELVEAQKWVLKALDISPDNTAAIYTLVKIAQERENYDELEKPLRTYLHLHPHDHHMLYTLAGILYKLGRNEDVIAALQEVITINPMDARAQALIKQAKRAMEKVVQPSAG